MASPYTLGVALAELVKAERAAIQAQGDLVKLTALGSATDADRAAFGSLAAQLLGIENALYAQLLTALNTFPDDVVDPIIQQIPAPTALVTPVSAGAKNPIVIPPALVWAAVVLAVLLAVVIAVSVVWTITISIDTVSSIILTYEQAHLYDAALQRRIDCVNSCVRTGQPLAGCTSSCNTTVVLPAPPTPPQPPVASNPNTPWYVGGTVLGLLGALGAGLWFWERGRRNG